MTTIKEYTADGLTANYTAPTFDPTLSSIAVKCNGVLKTLTTDYTYDSMTGQVTFVTMPASGTSIEIYRTTTVDARAVVFTNPSLLDADTQNKDSLQLFYALQEALDNANRAMRENGLQDFQWDAEGKRIQNLSAAPLADTDAVPKGYIDTRLLTEGTAVMFKETFTVTNPAGQTVFTLATSYQPSLDALDVFIDGVYQDSSKFVETDATTVTLLSPAAENSVVEVRFFKSVEIDYMNGQNVTGLLNEAQIPVLTSAAKTPQVLPLTGGTLNGELFVSRPGDGVDTGRLHLVDGDNGKLWMISNRDSTNDLVFVHYTGVFWAVALTVRTDGRLSVTADPANPLDVVTKQYADGLDTAARAYTDSEVASVSAAAAAAAVAALRFESAPFAVTNASTHVKAHGLGVTPGIVQVWGRKNNTFKWQLVTMMSPGTGTYGPVVVADATDITVQIFSNVNSMDDSALSGFSSGAETSGEYKIVAYK